MRIFGLILLSWIFSASFTYSQGNAYAKFDAKGATIGLYNLLPDATGCEKSVALSGTIQKVGYEIGDSVYSYTFTLNTNPKRQINFTVSDDEILQPDVEDIIRKNVRVRVQARQCGSAGFWSVEEVKRL